jgi:hypothetical protein
MKAINLITLVLVIVGGVNWGLTTEKRSIFCPRRSSVDISALSRLL